MYEQIDEDGAIMRLVDEIIEHKRMGDAVHADDALNKKGAMRQSTKGWNVLVKWRDGSTSWERLATMKAGYPVETAEYAVANKLVSKPAFAWWVPNTLKVREQPWTAFYPDAKEALPDDMPEPRGKPMQMIVFADADHAGDRVTRRSRTGILLYLNRAPILWYTKKQNSVETSTFGSEFMAAKAAVELIKGMCMRYKLRMLGIPLDEPAHLHVDNMSVVLNTSARIDFKEEKQCNRISFCERKCCSGCGTNFI
jgi:hypothetical protein